MTRRLPSYWHQLAIGLIIVPLALVSLRAGPIDVIFLAKPQFASNSCRAYALALALGTMPNSPVPIATVSDLRAAERDLQVRLAATAPKLKPPATPGSHSTWQRAVTEMTSGQIEAVVEYAPTVEAFYARVATLTGQDKADALGAAFSSAIVKSAVMTSVTAVGKEKYSTSHIVTLYGVARPTAASSSKRALAILNPAVKVAGVQQVLCNAESKNDERWSAVLSLEDSYSLTPFENGFLVMWLRRK